MIKKYIKPETVIYTVMSKSRLLISASTGDEMDYNQHSGLTPTIGDDGDAEGEFSRDNGGNSVWDNAW